MKKSYALQDFDVVSFDADIDTAVFEKIVGYKHESGWLHVFINGNTPLTSAQETYLADYVANFVPHPPSPLKVYRALPANMDPLISDFTILGFRKKAPHYDRGRKLKAEYWCATKDEIIVRKTFSDVRNSEGLLTDLQIFFEWFAEDGTVGLTKTEIVESFSKAKAETVERLRRERSIDFLISEARGTINEPFIDAIMDHFKAEITTYKSKGSDDFATALINETDPTILSILAAQVDFSSDPDNYTVPVLESIQYQIGYLSEAGLLATLQAKS